MGTSSGDEKKLVKDLATGFSFEYFPVLCSQAFNVDRPVTPLSAFFLGSILSYGARDKTKEKYLNKIGLAEDKTETAKIGYKQLLDELAVKGIRIDTTILVPPKVTLNSDFLNFSKKTFKAEIRIRDITTLDVAIKYDKTIVFENTTRFNPIWKTPFDSSRTVIRDFHLHDKPHLRVPPARLRTMYTAGLFRHGKLNDLKASFIELPLKTTSDDYAISMFVLRMNEDNLEDPANFKKNIRSLDLKKLLSSEEKQIELYLPKLNMNARYPLYFNGLTKRGDIKTPPKVSTDEENFDGIVSPSRPIETNTSIEIKINETGEKKAKSSAPSLPPTKKRRDVSSGPMQFEVNRPFVAIVIATKNINLAPLLTMNYPDKNYVHHHSDEDSDSDSDGSTVSESPGRRSGSCVLI